MDRKLTLILVVFLIAGATACATTKLTSTWKSPDAEREIWQGQKVLAMIISPNESMRRAAEDVLVGEMNKRGLVGVPSYSVIPKEEQNKASQDKIKARLEQEGIVGVVTMTPIDRQQQLTYVPGRWTDPYYGRFYDYYGWGWGAVYEPGYLQSDTIVTIETVFYSVKQGMLWGAVSETMNPGKIDSFVREVAGKVASELKKQGLTAQS